MVIESISGDNELEYLRLVFNAITYPIVILNSDGVIVDANKSANTTFLFFRNENLIGMDVSQITSLEVIEKIQEEGEMLIEDVEGLERYFFMLTSEKIKINNDEFYLVIARDVTEREKIRRLLLKALNITTDTMRMFVNNDNDKYGGTTRAIN